MDSINLLQKFGLFNEYWQPHVIAELNGQLVKLAKIKGEFVWHSHENEDELFLVVKGFLKIEFRDKTIELRENELCVVPRGVEHKPVADDEVWILLFEPANTINTGNANSELTHTQLKKI